MYRFLLRPRWLIGHVVVLALVVGMVGLGVWQLQRKDERQAANARVRARGAVTVPLDEVVRATDAQLPADAPFRRVTVRGTFDPAHEALVRFRIRDGLPGYEVLPPLRTSTGAAVLVDRGWLPLDIGDAPTAAPYAPPNGEVTVTGLLLANESEGRFRPDQRADGPLVIGSVHVPGLQARVPYDLYPGFVQLQEPDDPVHFPAPLPDPDLGAGPHLSYALQWFAFSTIALAGWVLLMRSSVTRRRTRPPGPIPQGR